MSAKQKDQINNTESVMGGLPVGLSDGSRKFWRPATQGRGDAGRHDSIPCGRAGMPPAAAAALLFCLAGAPALFAAGVTNKSDSAIGLVPIKVALELSAKSPLEPADVKFAVFPGGKRCAFAYDGVKRPETVAFFTKLGFRTTIDFSPKAKAEDLQAMEQAGAEIGISPWGLRGGYASCVEFNTLQETYDGVVTSRLVLREKCRGPLALGPINGHSGAGHTTNRDIDKSAGCGAAFMDANYLTLDARETGPYFVYLGFGHAPQLAVRDKNTNSRQAPNEKVYYQLMANQFRGTLDREKGEIVKFGLTDYDAKELPKLEKYIGEYGRHALIWHASDGTIAAYEYMKKRTRVMEIKSQSDTVMEITLGLERDTFPGFLLAPLCLEFPKDFPLKQGRIGNAACEVNQRNDGVYMDVPLREYLSAGCEMTLEQPAPNMSAPDEMPVVLKLRNTSEAPLENAAVEWVGAPGLTGPGLTVSSRENKPFKLEPKAEMKIEAIASTARGARFGLMPVEAVVKATAGGADRVFMAGFEIAVAPKLRVEMDPMNLVPVGKDRTQLVRVHLANGKAPDKFIYHKAGPCKGMLSLELPEGMDAVPREQPFELQENERKTFLFQVNNRAWGKGKEYLKPLIRLDGDKDPMEALCMGTPVIRDQARLEYEPLDKQGLLVYASYDDPNKGGQFDKSVGAPGAYYFPGHRAPYSADGVKGWCLEAIPSCQLHNPYKNIDYQAGTFLFWLRRDPKVVNELQVNPDPSASWKQGVGRSNHGETLMCIGSPQRAASSLCGMSLRRYPGWSGKEGYLEAVYQCMGNKLYYVQAAYAKDRLQEWRHIALLWSLKEKRLELYLDGKLAGKAESGQEEWCGVPWDDGGLSYCKFPIQTSDHGAWCGTCRDELYIYNRALTADEIRENMEKAKKK